MADAVAEENFGPYVVYERLGVGGMATVHRALEQGVEGFERVVALKRLLPHLAEDASFIKAFVREAKLASLLAHINIVQIYELGRVGTEYFISMEYIDGRDVRQILRQTRKVTGPAPMHVTVGLVLQMCEALDYAHTKTDDTGTPLGVVHRDVSPSNLLVTSQGHLKVIDFGIAKAQSSQLRTQTGRVKGKLAYMSPEAMAGGRDLDARSDVWAVGVILHELLTARPLFASKNEYQTLLKVQRGDIMPPSTFNQACPPELDAIAFKALARDADQRFASAAEMRRELERVRTKYSLHTGYRDIQQWLDWAFSIETPSSFSSANTLEPSQISVSVSRTPTPATQSRDDDAAAVEMAWGGDPNVDTGPVVLEDVPDVSTKHLRPATITDDPDDIPASAPSHGVRARHRTATSSQPYAPLSHTDDDDDDRRATQRADESFDTRSAADTSRDLYANAAAPVRDPVVRFTTSTLHPLAVATPVPGAGGLPQTRPGVEPASAHRLSGPIERRTRSLTIGAALVERNRPRRRWVSVAALVAFAGSGAALAWYATARAPGPVVTAQQPPPSHEPGTVKFETEPVDAEVIVEGATPAQHVGSPWQLSLAPGVHQVEIRHAGYKAWLTSLELSPRETQTMRVVLEPLGAAASADAMLAVSTTPAGLEVVLDGQPLAVRTPIRLPLKIGTHTVAVRQNGAIVWHQTLNAAAASNYEFNPNLAPHPDPAPEPTVAAPDTVTMEPSSGPSPAPTADAAPAAPAPAPAPAAVDGPAPATPPGPAPMPARASAGPAKPVTVAPNAVTKLSGTLRELHVTKATPSIAAAKLCIDAAGTVTSVSILSKLEPDLTAELTAALLSWRYQPYHRGAVAAPACFAVPVRLQ